MQRIITRICSMSALGIVLAVTIVWGGGRQPLVQCGLRGALLRGDGCHPLFGFVAP